MQETVTGPPLDPAVAQARSALAALASDLRADAAFVRSGVLGRLFDFLLEQSLDGRSPKGLEIADRVLGLNSDASDSSDASVRVYIHRLRRRLDDYYGAPGRLAGPRITLGRGEYRLVVQAADAGSPTAEPESQPEPEPESESGPELQAEEVAPAEVATPRTHLSRHRRMLAGLVAAVVGLATLNLVTAALLARARRDAPPAIAVRRQPPWSALLDDRLPTLVVLGDYYLFGDTEGGLEVKRLVRDFSINSRADLDAFTAKTPEAVDRYADVSLSYLPVASAQALQDVIPLVRPASPGLPRPRVVMMSKLTPDMLKRSNVVYIGYLSGLGLLRSPAFSASRFRIGTTYDEISDTQTGRTYISQAGSELPNDPATLDYGIVSAFPGPDGGRVIVIAGARDLALNQVADLAASAAAMSALGPVAHGQAFEALYEVRGINGVPLRSRVVAAAPLPVSAIWDPNFLGIKFPDR